MSNASAPPAPIPPPRWRIRGDTMINNILLVALAALIAFFGTHSHVFLSFSNFKVLLTNYAAIGVVAGTMTLLVIAGQVDLSIGSTIGFTGIMCALSITRWHLPPAAAIPIGIAAGAFVGAINGTLCSLLRFNPIIVTLGMLSVLRGSTLLIQPIEVAGLGNTFFYIGNGSFIGVPILLWIVGAVFAFAAGFLGLTVWGRYVYAIGINPQAAFLAALPVRSMLFGLYVATGMAAGVSGVLLAARLDGASPGSLGLQMELQALTIILLGGVAFAGGRGGVLGVITAWVFLAVLDNGLTLLNVPPFVQLVASGLALVFAASLDAFGTFIAPRIEKRRRVTERMESTAVEPVERAVIK
jgi:ribose transport system permease protein